MSESGRSTIIAIDVQLDSICDEGLTTVAKKQALNELRNIVNEVNLDQDAAKHLIQRLLNILASWVRCNGTADSHAKADGTYVPILYIVHWIAHKEYFSDYAVEVLHAMLSILRSKNGKAAYMAIKISIDIIKLQKKNMESCAKPLFDATVEIYQKVNETVLEVFGECGSENTRKFDPSLEKLNSSEPISFSRNLEFESVPLKSSSNHEHRFEILTECPIAVALLFQLYRSQVQSHISRFVLLALECIEAYPESQIKLLNAGPTQQCYVGVAEEIKNVALFTSLLSMKIKATSLIAYIHRNIPQVVVKYQKRVSQAIVNMMRCCPPNATSERKELLIAARLIWSTELKEEFVNHVDALLDENTVVGPEVTSIEYFRVAAHKTLIELFLNIRNSLSIKQISRLVHTYSRNANDPFFPINIHIMFFGLLSKLTDAIAAHSDRNEANDLLLHILDAFAVKYETTAGLLPILAQLENAKDRTNDFVDLSASGYLCLGYRQIVKTYAHALDNSSSPVRITRILLKYMAHCLKHIMITMSGIATNCKTIGAEANRALLPDIASQGTDIFMRILEHGIMCFNYWDISIPEEVQIRDIRKSKKISSLLLYKDEKEICEVLTSFFALLDSHRFNEIFSSKIEYIFQAILKNNSIVAIVEQFLVNPQISPLFISILLPFVLKKLGKPSIEPEHEPVILHLAKVVFATVVLSSDNAVRVIQSYVANVVLSIIKHAFISKDTESYLLVLKSIFCSISSVKSDLLYSKMTPMLQFMVDSFLSFLENVEDYKLRELLIELLLILPVKFNALVSYLPKLMSPLVMSLNSKGDPLNHGLQLLELCVDNLSRQILKSVVDPVLKELNCALRKHMRPQPYGESCSHSVARILGKLGNMSRSCLHELTHATSLVSPDPFSPKINITFREGYDPAPISVEKIISLSNKVILDPNQSQYIKECAYNFTKYCLPFFIETENKYIENVSLVKDLFFKATDVNFKPTERYEKLRKTLEAASEIIKYSRIYSYTNSTINEKCMSVITESILASCLNQNTKSDSEKLITGLCNYFSIMAVLNDIEDTLLSRIDVITTSPWLQSDVVHFQTFSFIRVMISMLSNKSESIRNLAANIIVQFFSSCLIIVGSKKNLQSLRALNYFVYSFCNIDYESSVEKKIAGELGVHIVIKRLDLDPRWLRGHALDFIKILICILRDGSSIENSKCNMKITGTMVDVLKKCYDTTHISPNLKETYSELPALISFLISELPNPSEPVRNGSKVCLNILSSLTKVNHLHLKNIIKEELIVKIVTRSHASVPYPSQIGRIDAVTYYLTLGRATIDLDEDFYYFVNDILTLAGFQDQLLVAKSSYFCSCASLKLLRLSSLALAFSMLNCSDFDYNQRKSLVSHVILTCIKLMYSKYHDVADEAYNCLKYVISRLSPPPSELLNIGFRPILINLSDYEKLTLPCIHVLVKFLELFDNNMKLEVGSKMFEHFKEGIQQIKQASSGKRVVNYAHKVKVTVTILSELHHLHPSSVKYVEEVIENVISVEENMSRKSFSPFRQPCIKYLSMFPQETIKYLIGKIDSLPHIDFFFDILKNPEAAPISAEALKMPAPFLNMTAMDYVMSDRRHLVCLKILSEMFKCRPTAFLDMPSLLEKVLNLWNDAKRLSRTNSNKSCFIKWKEVYSYLLTMLTSIIDVFPDNFRVLYLIVEEMGSCEFGSLFPLNKYIYEKFVVESSVELKQCIIFNALDVINAVYTSQTMSSKLLRYIVFPIIHESIKLGIFEQVITPDLMSKINNSIWAPDKACSIVSSMHTSLILESLHLTSLFVFNYPTSLKIYSKNVIRLVSWSLESSDMLCERTSCLIMAKLVTEYEVPLSYIYKLYYHLLSTQSFEPPQCGSLTFQALDSLLSYLSKVDSCENYSFIDNITSLSIEELQSRLGRKVPLYIYLIWRLAREETSTVSQLVVIYHIVIKFSDLFYEYRSIFVDPIVSLSVSFMTGAKLVSDLDLLIIGICELLTSWIKKYEQKFQKDGETCSYSSVDRSYKSKKIKSGDVAEQKQEDDECDIFDCKMNHLKSLVLSVLIKAITYNSSAVDKNYAAYNARIINNIKECLTMWEDVDVNIELLEQCLSIESPIQPSTVARVCNISRVYRVIIENKPSSWIVQASKRLLPQIEALINVDNINVVTAIIPVISGICEADDGKVTLQQNIVGMLNKRIHNMLRNTNIPQYSQQKTVDAVKGLNFVQVYCLLKLLSGFFTLLVNHVSVHALELISFLEKLTTEMGEKFFTQIQATYPPNTHLNSIETMLVILITSLSKMYMQNDRRKALVSFIVNIVKNLDSREILMAVMGVVRFWLSEAHESVTSLRENMNLIVSVILAFQHKTDNVIIDPYLSLVADLLTDQRYSCTEMISQLEPIFILGLRSENHAISKKFLEILNSTIRPDIYNRLLFCFRTKNYSGWSPIIRLKQALYLILECSASAKIDSSNYVGRAEIPLKFISSFAVEHKYTDKDRCISLEVLAKSQKNFLDGVRNVNSSEFIHALCRLLSSDDDASLSAWIEVFPICMSLVSESEHTEIGKSILSFLCDSQSFFNDTDSNSKMVQVLLESILKCKTRIILPPLLVKYLCKKFNAWHIGMDLLTNHFTDGRLYSDPMATNNDNKIREVALQTYGELLLELSEYDYFYGLSRQKCVFVETNCALAYEQASMWDKAQAVYQEAQKKACNGKIPFAEMELSMWSERWISCAEKLQQWDVLYDLSKYENDKEYMLECLWHLFDWSLCTEGIESIISSLKEIPHQRRTLFETFISLKKLRTDDNKHLELQKLCTEGFNLVLKSWSLLPYNSINAQIPLLHMLQGFSEIQEGRKMIMILSNPNISSLENKHKEVKAILSTWRERLPDFYEDINIWADLTHLRRHVLQLMNDTSHKNVGAAQVNSNSGSVLKHNYEVQSNVDAVAEDQTPLSFTGHKEMAWLICRFAHILRKQNMSSISRELLTNIYAYPNMESYEAFSKLKEQIMTYLVSPNNYSMGLDLVNNVNTIYFTNAQKAELMALRGAFLCKMRQFEKAEASFYSSIRMEFNTKKAWALWARFYETIFKDNPQDYESAANAVNCYMQAAVMFNDAGNRNFISRIIWLLSQSDENGTIAQVFTNYESKTPIWYWITFIPHLLSFTTKEAQCAHLLLMRIARQYPQSLYFYLRTSKEDSALTLQKSESSKDCIGIVDNSPTTTPHSANPDSRQTAAENSSSWTPRTTQMKPLSFIEEEMNVIRMTFPLLTLSMETLLDWVIQRLKQRADEDIYRLIMLLLNEGVYMILQQFSKDPDKIGPELSSYTVDNLARFSENMYPNHIKYKKAFTHDFVESKPNLIQLVEKFKEWRDQLELILDSKTKRHDLNQLGHKLRIFESQQIEEVEIPGQYLLLRDSNSNFIRVDRIEPTINLVQGYMSCHREIVVRGHDGSLHPFIIQHPATKFSRREDNIFRLIRLLNDALKRKADTRRRDLEICVPTMVLLTTSVQLVVRSDAFVTFQNIWEHYCKSRNLQKDIVTTTYIEWINKIYSAGSKLERNFKSLGMRTEILEEITRKYVPDTILKNYLENMYSSYSDFWMIRKRFTLSLSALTFFTYSFSIGQRLLHRLNLNLVTGNVWTTDMFLIISPVSGLYTNNDAVPFRYTPNIQTFVTPAGTEGLFAPGIMAVARALTDNDEYLEYLITSTIREDINIWASLAKKPISNINQLRDIVLQNCALIVKRAMLLSCTQKNNSVSLQCPPHHQQRIPVTPAQDDPDTKSDNTVIIQPVVDLISQASNPIKLAQMEISYCSPF